MGRSISIAHFVQRRRKALNVNGPEMAEAGHVELADSYRTEALSFAGSPRIITSGSAVSEPVATDDSVRHDD